MDDRAGGMIDFSEVRRQGEEEEQEIEEIASRYGRKRGRAIFSALTRARSMPLPDRVKVLFQPGGKYCQHAAAVLPIVAAMRPTWWEKRKKQSPDEIANTLIGYANERAERAKKKAEREREKSSRMQEARPSPQEIMVAGWLTVPVSEKVLSVIEKSVEFYSYPERRPPSAWPEVKIKDWESMSRSTQAVYKRSIVQTMEELKELQAKTSWDIVSYLVNKAETRSRSVYNRHRATVIQLARAKGNKKLEDIIRSMPPYKMVCEMLGVTGTPRVGEITKARRKQKNEKTWEALQLQLSPLYRDCVCALRTTGARVGELHSLSLSKGTDGSIIATISTSKIGARRRGDTPPTRDIVYRIGTTEHDFLCGLLAERGAMPFANVKPDHVRSAWYRARQKLGVGGGQEWCLHALRHAYASKRKNEIHRQMVEKHGADWRRRLYGTDWKNSKTYREEIYGELARELGHSNNEMTKLYG